jgi:hypothetical protein
MPWRHMGEWKYSSTILKLDIRWRWVVSFTPQPLYPGETAPGTLWIGGWVGPRTGLDDVERRKILPLPGLELRPLGLPGHSHIIYKLKHTLLIKLTAFVSNVITVVSLTSMNHAWKRDTWCLLSRFPRCLKHLPGRKLYLNSRHGTAISFSFFSSSPIYHFISQSLLFDLFPVLSSLLDVFRYLAKTSYSSWSQRSLSFNAFSFHSLLLHRQTTMMVSLLSLLTSLEFQLEFKNPSYMLLSTWLRGRDYLYSDDGRKYFFRNVVTQTTSYHRRGYLSSNV